MRPQRPPPRVSRNTRHFEGLDVPVVDRQRPIAKIVPFTVADDDDAALVAGGLMREGSGILPPSFWKARRSHVSVKAAVAAVSADRDQV